jgi:CDP-glycerol glycerophosphotransferase (TagB/SpsB family)
MRGEISRLPANGDGIPNVLYAPAWGVRSSVLTHGTGIIDSLVEAGIKVIFRPHPQFYVSHVELIHDIEKRLAGTDLVEIDRGRTALASMARSDVLITDLSGILFDFACLFSRPILLANSSADPGGHEGEDMTGALWDVTASRDLSYALVDGLEALPDLVRRARRRSGEYEQKAREFRNRSFYNFGEAGPAAARNILSAFRSLS